MEFALDSSTFPTQKYMPDELAKLMVSELNLKSGDTVSKDKIIEYLEKAGAGPTWVTDVAMVLRNMFNVTPIFYESSSLVSELSELLESTSIDNASDITHFGDNDYSIAYGMAIDNEFSESDSEEDEAIVAALSEESLETILEIAQLEQIFTSLDFAQVEACYQAGGVTLVEAWHDAYMRPHMVRFMDHRVVSALSEAIGDDLVAMSEAVSPMERSRRKEIMLKRSGGTGDRGLRDMRASNRAPQDPLAGKGSVNPNRPGHGNSQYGRYTKAVNKASVAGPSHQGDAQVRRSRDDVDSQRGQSSGNSAADAAARFKASKLRQAADKMAGAKPMPFPSDSARGGQPPETHVHLGAAPGSSFDQHQKPKMSKSINVPKKSTPQHDLGADHAVPRAQDFHAMAASAPKLHPVKRALGAVGRIASKIGHHIGNGASKVSGTVAKSFVPPGTNPAHTGPSEPSEHPQAQADKGGLGHRVVQGAKRLGSGAANIAANFNDMAKAKARVRMPGLTYAIHGAPKEGELKAAQHLGLHREFQRMGHILPGHDERFGSTGQHEPSHAPIQPRPRRSNARRPGIGLN